MIHVPREEHQALLRNFHRMLKPFGLLLLCMGIADWPGAIEEYFGAPMYWSYYDAETNLRITKGTGFEVIRSEIVPDGLDSEPAAKHLFLLGQKQELNPG